MPSTAPIGVFDSGLGGLSVLRALRQAFPQESFVYFGDTQNAPYGVRPPEDIVRLCHGAVDELLHHGIKALVIACNTATGVCQEALEQRLNMPVIGIQPALQAAQALRKQGDILALATPATFKTARYAALKQAHGQHVIDLPCPGLMDFVERGELEGPALQRFLANLFAQQVPEQVDVVVLGCTHYPFLAGPIGRFFPHATLLDDSPRVVAALKQALTQLGLLRQAGPGGVLLRSSGGEEAVQSMHRLLMQAPGKTKSEAEAKA